ncbi:MAG: hypothetical protein ACKOE4_03070 [Candidatus Kapaibacterium sp.]
MRSNNTGYLNKQTWILGLLASLICIGLYYKSTAFMYVGLDDTIFVRELESYNKSDSAITHSFKRGVFGDTTDTYYRPLLLSSFALDRYREGKRGQLLHAPDTPNESLSTYRWTNILLHSISVFLFFVLLRKLFENPHIAFVGGLILAVHPALVQAVAWIPGRNDTLLACFTLSFVLAALRYVDSGKSIWVAVQMLLFLAAVFTKETGLVSALAVLAILVGMYQLKLSDRRLLVLAASWVASTVLWFVARSNATVQNKGLETASLVSSTVDRLPVLLQYLGKSLIPVDLAVVPYQEQTTLVYGMIAVGIVGLLIVLSRKSNWSGILVSLVWFLVFMTPLLLVPRSLNQETYEHRLYLPIMGIIMFLFSTDVVTRLGNRQILLGGVVLGTLLFVMSFVRQDAFRDRSVFWESAVQGSPNSAFCLMNLGSTYMMSGDPRRESDGERLIRQAHRIDSTIPFINYYMGQLYWRRNQHLQAEPFLRNEYKTRPHWAELSFMLAQCAIERRDLSQGQKYLEQYISLNPFDQMASNNLLLVCLDAGRFDDAARNASLIEANGLIVPQKIRDRITGGLNGITVK